MLTDSHAYLPTVPHSAGLSSKTDLCLAVRNKAILSRINVPLAVKITHVGRQSKATPKETRIWKRNDALTRCAGACAYNMGGGFLRVDFLSAKHVPQILCGVPQNTTVCPAEKFFWLASMLTSKPEGW